MSADRRRQQLLDSALAAFARTGYEDTTMQDIADEAGVAKGLLSRHWRSKEALFCDLRRHVGADLVKHLRDAAAPEVGADEALAARFGAWASWHAANREAIRVFLPVATLPEPDLGLEDAFAALAGNELASLPREVRAALMGAAISSVLAMHDRKLDPAAAGLILSTFAAGALEAARRVGGLPERRPEEASR